jgi:brevianamide F synthase
MRAQHHTSALFNFWRQLLDGASMTYLDTPSSSSSSFSNNAIIPPAPSAEIVQQTRQITLPPVPAPFTTATIHKAAWALVLARRTQTRDIVFGEVVNGRSLPMDGISDVLGPCVTHIPVRVRLNPKSTVQDLLRHIQTQHAQSIAYDTGDMREIVARSTSWPAGTYFGSATQHQNIPIMSADPFAGELARFETRVFNVVPRMPHIVSTPRGDGGLEIMLWADSRQVGGEMVDELLREFGEVFVRLASDVEAYVGDLL